MDVSSASSILFNVRDHAAVKTAQANVDSARRELDKVDTSLKGDFGVKQANYGPIVDQFWEAQQYSLRQPVGMACLIAIAGCGFGASFAASLVPGLEGLRGLIMIGGFVAGFKYVPKLMGKFIFRPLLQRSVTKRVNRYLETERVRIQQRIEIYQKAYDRVMVTAMDELTRKAAADQLARASQHGNTEVKIEEQQVRLGAVVVPRRAQDSALQPDMADAGS